MTTHVENVKEFLENIDTYERGIILNDQNFEYHKWNLYKQRHKLQGYISAVKVELRFLSTMDNNNILEEELNRILRQINLCVESIGLAGGKDMNEK